MKKALIGVAVAASVLAGPALASDSGYFELGYASVDYDVSPGDLSVDASAIDAELRMNTFEDMFAELQFTKMDFDVDGANAPVGVRLGVGKVFDIAPTVELETVGQILKYENGDPSIGVTAEVYYHMIPTLTARLGADIYIGDNLSGHTLFAGLDYHIMPSWDLRLDFDASDLENDESGSETDVTALRIGAQYKF